jgi:hypothetical protein
MADADGVVLPSDPEVAYVDVVTAGGQILTGGCAWRDIVAAAGVVEQPGRAETNLVDSGGVPKATP